MNILVIDDDSDDVELFTEAIQGIGTNYRIYRAANGEQGLQIARTLRPDVIFLDINMPVMNGRDTLLEIRKDRLLKRIAVCMLSTTNNGDEIRWCKKAGANGFVVKPPYFRDLCLALKTFIQVHSNPVVR